MKKSIILILFVVACQQNPNSATVDMTMDKTSVATSGEDVNILKGIINSYLEADWQAYRSYFSEEAVVVHNAWWDDESQQVSIDEMIEFHKDARERLWKSVKTNEPIFEVVKTEDGSKYGHVWLQFDATDIENNNYKPFFYASYPIVDGKVIMEWASYDSAGLPQ